MKGFCFACFTNKGGFGGREGEGGGVLVLEVGQTF